LRNLADAGYSAFGVGRDALGVMMAEVPVASDAAKAGYIARG